MRPEGEHGHLLTEVRVGVETERVVGRAESHKVRLAMVCVPEHRISPAQRDVGPCSSNMKPARVRC